jgi:hypothetical protein
MPALPRHDRTLETDSAPEDLVVGGFDGLDLEAVRTQRALNLMRVGRWLRGQGARRPTTVRVINDRTLMIDGRILSIDDYGSVRDLSTARRCLGTPFASQASWGRRR